MSLSKHCFIGRLTKDPEVKIVKINGEDVSVANFTVAVDEDGASKETDFYDVVAWRGLAENVGKFLGKGRLVYVEGRPKRRSYDKDVNGTAVKIYVYETRATTVQFLDRGETAPAQAQATQPAQAAQPAQANYQPAGTRPPF
jgi:single-strand DNA-binding protein